VKLTGLVDMKSPVNIAITEDIKLKVFKYIKQNGFITNRQCRDLLGIGYDQAITLFNNMVNANELIREGKTSSIKYRLPSKNKTKG
jgi:hypothetical protein